MTEATDRQRRATRSTPRTKTHIERLDKPSKIMELRATEFMIDPRVQRQLNEARADAMAADFRPDSLGLITASKRVDGRYYVVDGNHRVSAARKAKYDDLLAVRVFEDLTITEEAGLFLTLNNSQKVQAIDKFKVRITLGDRVATNINKILGMYGLHVDWSAAASPNSISAVVTLEKVYRGAGVRPDGEYADLIDKVIGTITRTQDVSERRTVFSRVFVEGLGIFFATFGNRVDKSRIEDVLSQITPAQLGTKARNLRDAKGGTIGENSAEVIWQLYNNRLRVGKLPAFDKVVPMNNYLPEHDPLYVNPADYIIEPANA